MKRSTWAVICVCIAVALICMVGYYWHKIGCGWWSLFAEAAFYTSAVAALWSVVDDVIKED